MEAEIKKDYILWVNYGDYEGWGVKEQFDTIAQAKDWMTKSYLDMKDTLLTKRINFEIDVTIDARIDND